MEYFIPIKTSKGRQILIEIDPPASAPKGKKKKGKDAGGVVGAVTASGIAEKALETVADLGDQIASICGDVVEKFEAMLPSKQPTQIELNFSLKLGTEGNIKIVKLSGEGTFAIKAVWSKKT